MAYVPKFNHDVFISHAHKDEVPPGSGWISKFTDDLTGELRDRLGSAVEVFTDKRLDSDVAYRRTLRKVVEHSAVFLMVGSQSFIESDFCKEEWEWFKESSRPDGPRVFKAVKFPDRLGIFHIYGVKTTPIGFYKESNPRQQLDLRNLGDSDNAFYQGRLATLAEQISERLEQIEACYKPVFLTNAGVNRFGDEFTSVQERLKVKGNRIQRLGANFPPNIMDEDERKIYLEIEHSESCLFLLWE
jgi:hypothetical protein